MVKVTAMGLMLRRLAPANNIPKFNYCHAA
jgi:hypothetical protein